MFGGDVLETGHWQSRDFRDLCFHYRSHNPGFDSCFAIGCPMWRLRGSGITIFLKKARVNIGQSGTVQPNWGQCRGSASELSGCMSAFSSRAFLSSRHTVASWHADVQAQEVRSRRLGNAASSKGIARNRRKEPTRRGACSGLESLVAAERDSNGRHESSLRSSDSSNSHLTLRVPTGSEFHEPFLCICSISSKSLVMPQREVQERGGTTSHVLFRPSCGPARLFWLAPPRC